MDQNPTRSCEQLRIASILPENTAKDLLALWARWFRGLVKRPCSDYDTNLD